MCANISQNAKKKFGFIQNKILCCVKFQNVLLGNFARIFFANEFRVEDIRVFQFFLFSEANIYVVMSGLHSVCL